MPGDAVYGFALIAIAAWIGLFYVVIFRPSGSLSTSRPRRYYRTPFRNDCTPFRTEKALGPDTTNAGQQLNAARRGARPIRFPTGQRKLSSTGFSALPSAAWQAPRQ